MLIPIGSITCDLYSTENEGFCINAAIFACIYLCFPAGRVNLQRICLQFTKFEISEEFKES